MDPREAPEPREDGAISDGEATAYALDSDIKWFVRTAVRGVPRHHRSAYMYQRLLQAHETGNNLEAAVFFSELATMVKPVPTRRVPFNFNSVSEDESLIRFRFSKAELVMLIDLMGLTETITRERTKAPAIEALCILLYRLAAPVRGTELQDYFGRSESGISNIFLHTLNFLDVKFKKLLAFGGHIAATRLCVYANAIFKAGSPYTNIWSFIDGTVRDICRPQPRKNGSGKMLTQQSVYNGHKRKHGLKFQTLVTPDGLIIHLFGPFPGRNHDIKMFAKSGLADQVRSDFRFADYRIFGDCAYGRDDVMLSPFEGALGNLTEAQKEINSKMSKVRVSVEWSYAQVVNYWKTLDVKSNLRVGTQPVGQMYRVGILMTNCITCTRGGNTASDYFGVKPPDIREYLTTHSN